MDVAKTDGVDIKSKRGPTNRMQLADIQRGDIFGQAPDKWWEKRVCRIQGAKTFHWGWFVAPITGDADWATSESVSKGVDITRLAGRHVYVWRLKNAKPLAIDEAVAVQSEYGDLPYSWEADVWTALYYIARDYLRRILPIRKWKGFNCLGWVVCYGVERGYKLVPDGEPATQKLLEDSPQLECIGEINSESQIQNFGPGLAVCRE